MWATKGKDQEPRTTNQELNVMCKFPKEWAEFDVALSHDWLTGMRGGERVLEILCKGFPEASINTLIHNREVISQTINSHPITTSWLQSIPGVSSHYRSLLPIFPAAIKSMKPPQGDLLISTSHCVAKALRTSPETKHLCYCFTPMRYAWTFYDEYFGDNRIKAAIAKPMLAALRRWDFKASRRVDRFVAISKHVQKRIKTFYGRDSDIVYPPVDTERCTPGETTKGTFDLIVSAMVPYKRIDLAVSAYNKTGYPLKVVGVGGQLDKLRAMAKDNIEFSGWCSDKEVLELYRSCRMLVFPGEEDFGIVPLEVQSCGKPVVAYAKGGALETIQNNVTGIHFDEQNDDSLIDAVEICASKNWDPNVIRTHAESFGIGNFISGIADSIEKCRKTS